MLSFKNFDFVWKLRGLNIRVSASLIFSANKGSMCLLAVRNRKQYAMILRSLTNDEDFSKIPKSLDIAAKHVFVFSSGNLFTCMLSLGHSCLTNQDGPVTHVWFRKNVWSNWPLEMISAGLSSDLTCRHSHALVSSWISATRVAT